MGHNLLARVSHLLSEIDIVGRARFFKVIRTKTEGGLKRITLSAIKPKHFFKSRVDPFSKKDWYDVKAPAMFNIRNIGKTLVTRTQGTSEYLFRLYFS